VSHSEVDALLAAMADAEDSTFRSELTPQAADSTSEGRGAKAFGVVSPSTAASDYSHNGLFGVIDVNNPSPSAITSEISHPIRIHDLVEQNQALQTEVTALRAEVGTLQQRNSVTLCERCENQACLLGRPRDSPEAALQEQIKSYRRRAAALRGQLERSEETHAFELAQKEETIAVLLA
jgi:hypothetical protein